MQQHGELTEEDIFAALERIHTEKAGGGGIGDAASTDEGVVTPLIRRTIATYMASKAIVGLATPDYDELQRVVVTPDNAPTGYVYFIPQDAHLETEIVTRSFMEGHMVVRSFVRKPYSGPRCCRLGLQPAAGVLCARGPWPGLHCACTCCSNGCARQRCRTAGTLCRGRLRRGGGSPRGVDAARKPRCLVVVRSPCGVHGTSSIDGVRAQVAMAGRVAETAVMGAANMTTAGAGDLQQASDVARDMVFKCGWSLSLGPVNLGDDDDADMLGGTGEMRLGDMSPQMAGAGLADMGHMLRAAEAKAYFALVMNWELLQAMVNRLMTQEPHALSRCGLPACFALHSIRLFNSVLAALVATFARVAG
jgi:Peptidase family M41